MRVVLASLLVLSISSHVRYLASAQNTDGKYLNEWVAEIPGGLEHAKRVASQHDYVVSRQLKSIPDHYMLQRTDVPHRSRREANHHSKKLAEDHRVNFAQQQNQKFRYKRDFLEREEADEVAMNGANLNDPYYEKQWYLNPQADMSRRSDVNATDMGVTSAWSKGYTGKGVFLTVLDDGIERLHPDLASNYAPNASWDINDNDDDPTPRYEFTNENKHGTRCAGEIAMLANNNICGVGIAFDSKVGGIRMLDGTITDRVEGESIGFCKNVDICSASWGPNDDGKTVEGPGLMAKKGLIESIEQGRNGKGTIMVWAAGNGGRHGDNCNADGYTSDIHTLSVSSASESGTSPWYSEHCASTLAATYSSGSAQEGKVISTDLRGECTRSHTGTSASAPMAAGILALALEANPDLTWRDVQHLVVYTSSKDAVAKDSGWYRNGVGYCVNLKFGFGLMNARALVDMAVPEVWELVGPQRTCVVESATDEQFPVELVSGSQIEVAFTTDGCKGQEHEIRFLEHVQVKMTLTYPERGKIYVELESPSGTITPIMLERPKDKSTAGYVNWRLTSAHQWGENPEGTWKVRIADRKGEDLSGQLKNLSLILYGTKEQPFYHKYGPKDCGDVEPYSTKLKSQSRSTSHSTEENAPIAEEDIWPASFNIFNFLSDKMPSSAIKALKAKLAKAR